MPRVDDYKQALDLGKTLLSGRNPDLVAGFAGTDMVRDDKGHAVLSFDFLNRGIKVSWPDMELSFDSSQDEIPIQQQILLLHYLNGAWSSSGPVVTGEWIAFQDVPDGKFYLGAFLKRARDPLMAVFGDKPRLMVDLAARAYGAEQLDYGDFSVAVKALPLVRVGLILWEGDDEFPPEGNILFDKNIKDILSAEDIAWLAGMVVYPLMGMAK